MLKQLEEALISFRSAFVSGTGCPQLNLSFALQLQRKGSSMDFFNFYLDILAVQPPSSLADPFGLGVGGGGGSLFPNFNRNQLNYRFFALSSSSALVSSSLLNPTAASSSRGSSSASNAVGFTKRSLSASTETGSFMTKQSGEQRPPPWSRGATHSRETGNKKKKVKGEAGGGIPSFYRAGKQTTRRRRRSRTRRSTGRCSCCCSSSCCGRRLCLPVCRLFYVTESSSRLLFAQRDRTPTTFSAARRM